MLQYVAMMEFGAGGRYGRGMDWFKPRPVAVMLAVGLFACGEEDPSTTLAVSMPTSVSASDPSSATGSSTSEESTGTAETGATSTPDAPTTGSEPTTDEPTSESTGVSTTGSEPGSGHAGKIQPIWDANCLTGCHGPGGQGTPWGKLTSDSAYEALVGANALEAPGMKRVEPGDRNASYLWHKLNGTQGSVGGSGTRMPAPPQSALTSEELGIIGAWIDAGAPP